MNELNIGKRIVYIKTNINNCSVEKIQFGTITKISNIKEFDPYYYAYNRVNEYEVELDNGEIIKTKEITINSNLYSIEDASKKLDKYLIDVQRQIDDMIIYKDNLLKYNSLLKEEKDLEKVQTKKLNNKNFIMQKNI